ncbi:ERCC4 domain-containing protein [Mycobacterium sp. pV006]|uniref:ERCC4 domain-containing protein n=1 Tax=Mycobacterium sp. pV006 TaxID=3238983 RepID=UPI00351B0DC5
MPDMLIAHNPEEGTTLPYLIWLPLGAGGVTLKARETWPRTNKVYCHRLEQWPDGADIIERLPVRSISRRGAAIDLVLERGRENRSQFVLTRARGREMVFWQSRRTAKQARPNVALPTARAHGRTLEIVVDSHERYGYKFSDQQADTLRRALPAGDYAVYSGDVLVASAERKSIEDLSAGLLSGKLTYQLADLAALPRAVVVVEAGYSRLFKLEHVSSSVVAEALAEAQARFPSVPIVFVETRVLAQEWIYRWLGACLHEHELHTATPDFRTEPQPGPQVSVSNSDIRLWARERGLPVGDRGKIPAGIVEQFLADQHR